MNKIIFFVYQASPYKVSLFNIMNKFANIFVIYEERLSTIRDASWLQNHCNEFDSYYLSNSKNPFKSYLELYKLLKNDNVLYVVNGDYSSPSGMVLTYLAKKFKKKLIILADGAIRKKRLWVIDKLMKSQIGKADIALSSCEITDDYFRYYGGKEMLIKRYPFTSLTTEEIRNNNLTYKSKKNTKVILSVGQIIHRKGHDILIDVMSLLPDYKCYIIGGQPTQDLIERMKKNNVTNVEFLPFMQKDKLKTFYEKASLFVFPTREDIWGLVINEALSFGLPIISTDKCNAAVHFVENYGCGFITEVGDINKIIEYIKVLEENDDMYEQFCKQAILSSHDYTMEKSAELIYTNIIK